MMVGLVLSQSAIGFSRKLRLTSPLLSILSDREQNLYLRQRQLYLRGSLARLWALKRSVSFTDVLDNEDQWPVKAASIVSSGIILTPTLAAADSTNSRAHQA
jgi:hypothetical protein